MVVLGWALGEWVAERTPLTLLLAYLPPLVWLAPELLAAWAGAGTARAGAGAVGRWPAALAAPG